MNATSPHAAPPLARHAPIASGEIQDTLPTTGRATGQTPAVCCHCRWFVSERGHCLAHDRQTTATDSCPAWWPDTQLCGVPSLRR